MVAWAGALVSVGVRFLPKPKALSIRVMRAFIAPSLCVAAFLAWGSAASAGAAATARANGEVQITDSNGILVTQDLSFQTQLPSGNLQSFASSGSGANVLLTGSASQTVSLAVPTSFDVTRAGGPESYVVTTFGVPGSMLLGGSLRENGALSVDVSGRVALAGRSTVPGAYRGLLVVIAQYN